ncbi:hypothetical protein ACO0K0_11640 [Undibacterium sp. SXout11W]|uniref:hypothetical protein n=1 Tax=Undibacterium sp. SXout11W TaxID=3413050 RepID=UPI003BF1D3BD
MLDDIDSTVGFLILMADDPEFNGSHDSWVEDESALLRYFQAAGWSIDWKCE